MSLQCVVRRLHCSPGPKDRSEDENITCIDHLQGCLTRPERSSATSVALSHERVLPTRAFLLASQRQGYTLTFWFREIAACSAGSRFHGRHTGHVFFIDT